MNLGSFVFDTHCRTNMLGWGWPAGPVRGLLKGGEGEKNTKYANVPGVMDAGSARLLFVEDHARQRRLNEKKKKGD